MSRSNRNEYQIHGLTQAQQGYIHGNRPAYGQGRLWAPVRRWEPRPEYIMGARGGYWGCLLCVVLCRLMTLYV